MQDQSKNLSHRHAVPSDRFQYRAWNDRCHAYIGHFDKLTFDGSHVYVHSDEYISYMEVDGTNIILEQSTGIRDINNKLIFEGDIVRMSSDILCSAAEHQDRPCVVEFCDMGFGFIYPHLPDELKSAGWNECATYEIIGNVHENPELLEGK